MGKQKDVQLAPDEYLIEIARKGGLLEQFEVFRRVVPMIPDFKGFLFAVNRLRDILRHPDLPGHWQTLAPFDRWLNLFNLFHHRRKSIVKRGGPQIGAGCSQQVHGRSVIHGYMEAYPLLAMICTVHENVQLDLRYGGLQLQLLHAHWEKIRSFEEHNPSHRTIRECRQPKSGRRHKNDIKLSNNAARAVRKFQPIDLKSWLDAHDTLVLPTDFRYQLIAEVPLEPGMKKIHTILRRYFAPGHRPRDGGRGGPRHWSPERYLFMVDYRGHRYGLVDGGNSGEEGGEADQNPRTEHVTRTHVNRHKKRRGKNSNGGKGKPAGYLSNKDILDLGLDPIELSDGEIDVLTDPNAGGNRSEGTESAHARIRGLEIDRRLYPWNSQAIRLEEFQKELLPHLRDSQKNCPENPADRAAAAAIAIAAETGRTIEQVLQLRIEQIPSSPFSFCPPTKKNRCGLWKWDAVSPRYRRDISGDYADMSRIQELAVNRAEYLVYPASKIVTDLILHFTKDRKAVKRNLLFPYQAKAFAGRVRRWLSKIGVDSRFTLPRISHLMWDLMHRNTGGELASVCLTLGLPHPLAQVELFYAVLHEAEAGSIFHRSKTMLWGKPGAGARFRRPFPDPRFARFTGCRAFPRIEEVKRIIDLFRQRSEAFFNLSAVEFRPAEHRQLLNGAVMYLLWHQFFSFGTRTISDAYQKLDGFMRPSGIGILSDKDFASGYKTRIVVANDPLRRHMAAVESRLAELRNSFPKHKDADLGPVWLLNAKCRIVEPSPSTIQEVLKIDEYNFPFPVNTPRRVMRYLLRKSGMTHSYAEAYMGHWWHGREPFSPFSSFNFASFVDDLNGRLRRIVGKQLGICPGS
jgi:hypothetical protein